MWQSLKIVVPVMYLIAIMTVVLTGFIPANKNLLELMTRENGFFETLSVITLFCVFLYGLVYLLQNRGTQSKPAFIVILGVSILAFLAAMEEISWGQQLFHFQSSDYFLQKNHQKETNLHNLIDSSIFSSIVYTSIYTLFVFIPLLYKLLHKYIKGLPLLRYFDFNPHSILVFLYASVFQLFFMDDIGVIADMAAHIAGLLLFGYFLWVTEKHKWLLLHYGFVVFATVVSIANYTSYSFFNRQYEIREFFVVLALLLVFIEFIDDEKTTTNNHDAG